MTEQERRSIANGIWLCAECAYVVDRDSGTFSTSTLHDWKSRAELEAERVRGKAGHVGSADIVFEPGPDTAKFYSPELEKRVGADFRAALKVGVIICLVGWWYAMTAPCIFESCTGVVKIEPPLPREKVWCHLVDVCSRAGRHHTYAVDVDYRGRRYHFDWRPLNPPPTKARRAA